MTQLLPCGTAAPAAGLGATAALVLVCLAGAALDARAEDPAAVAAAEYAEVMALTPDPDNGRRVYLTCAVCHRPEGWGSRDGTYPQIAGQLRTVIVKQLADIRARNRDNPLMYPFSVARILGGPQNIADVAAYVSQLPMTPDNGTGPGTDLAHGEHLFREHCVRCHGERGMGNEAERLPQIAGQHFAYLVRQLEAIRSGRRKNSDSKMVKQIQDFDLRDRTAVLDYVSRLAPPAGKVAPRGWTNPDFPEYVRAPLGSPSGADPSLRSPPAAPRSAPAGPEGTAARDSPGSASDPSTEPGR